jgi:hypothetical protein
LNKTSHEATAGVAPPANLGVAEDTTSPANEMPVRQDVDVNDVPAVVHEYRQRQKKNYAVAHQQQFHGMGQRL